MPPILHEGNFIIEAHRKADLFSDYFAGQCTTFINDSQLPTVYYRTNARLSDLKINQQKILEIFHGSNPNKSHGCDNISIKMIKICRNQIVLPLNHV